MAPNPFLLAADGSPDLIPLLRETPLLASSQDEHGYSLVHASASYNHLNLLRTLILEFGVDVNLKDEDNETALFVVETVEAAKCLVEELHIDVLHRGSEGMAAHEKIAAEAEFPDVAHYLASIQSKTEKDEAERTLATVIPEIIPPPPDGMHVTLGTMDPTQDIPAEVDSEFRRRIEELAQRDDFSTAQGQAQLRKLVEDALTDQGIGEERNVRSKQA
ncbi:hypothetical protein N3K66_005997 [Trichothecium roseum]|uniref:Uncharacterized protein n=1 Tax=Trichothecium roseum TaxID=47278 RepID=A0ACC0UZS7_9HYPO|nr:hypothetical protein N3K66_005997 [Trichothecium roseum]